MRNVSNELAHEFMRNILSVTNATTETDDVANLENYLLDGRGWKLLFAIHKIGVQVKKKEEERKQSIQIKMIITNNNKKK